MMRKPISMLGTAVLATMLAACGGDGDGGSPTPTPTPTPTPAPTPTPTPTPPGSGFTESATWRFVLPATGELCYDFNAKAEVAGCSGNAWDLKIKSGGRSATLWTNSGTSGTGAGGAFGGPFDHSWAELLTWQNATTDPTAGAIPATLYFQDSVGGVFSGTNAIGSATFEYGVGGDHLLYPTWRTFLITTDSASADAVGTRAAPVFALQVTGYYGGPGRTTSGWPSFRWVDRGDATQTVRTASVDATAGWVYFDLVAGAISSPAGTWHIAFNRYNFKLNGGDSGGGKVAGFLARTPDGFYDAMGKPVAAKFKDAANAANTLVDLTASDLAVPRSASKWVRDANASPLNPAYTGSYPEPLDFGWYSYYPTAAAASAAGLPAVAHQIRANDDKATLLRGGEGGTYARVHVTQIRYADPNDASSEQTWTIHFDVQP